MKKIFICIICSIILTNLFSQWNEVVNEVQLHTTVKYRYDVGFIVGESYKKGVVISKDKGNTFENFSSSIIPNAFHYMDSTIFTGGYYNKVLSTRDFGKTFTDLTSTEISSKGTNCIITGFQNSILLGTKKDGIYQYDLTNKIWKRIGFAGEEITGLLIKDNVLFANVNYKGVYKSLDEGINWSSSKLTYNNSPYDLILFKGNLIYGTHGAGIFNSDNNGVSWNNFNNGLDNQFIASSFCISKDENHLFVIGYNRGVFYYDEANNSWTNITENLPTKLGEKISIVGNEIFVTVNNIPGSNTTKVYKRNIENLISKANDLLINNGATLKIFPNPALDVINIDISNVDRSIINTNLSLIISNNNGERLKEIKLKSINNINQDLSISDLHSGEYFIGLMANNRIIARGKFIKVI